MKPSRSEELCSLGAKKDAFDVELEEAIGGMTTEKAGVFPVYRPIEVNVLVPEKKRMILLRFTSVR